MLANGISAETMMQANAGDHPFIPPIQRQDVFRFNKRELLQRGLKLPRKTINALFHYFRNRSDMSLFDLLWSMLEALPSGLYDGEALDEYIRRGMSDVGLSNRFEMLDRELFIIATDLDNGERAVFGKGYLDAPISMAVAASAALPILYKPVRINGHEYIDGGARGTASLDLAIEHGAKLVICINPLVPFDNSNRADIPFLGEDGGYMSEKGLQAVANQSLRTVLHSGLHYHVKQLRRAHPDVDIILIEPRADDRQMFFYNIMRYSARLIVAQHGFESVTLDLAEDYHLYRDIMTRHGIPITRRLVIEELNTIQKSGYDPEVIRRVLEARVSFAEFHNKLDDLDSLLANLTADLA